MTQLSPGEQQSSPGGRQFPPSEQEIFDRLRTIIDPETGINIVDMGFIYSVKVVAPDAANQDTSKPPVQIHILYTLTTPGCPLASTLQAMIFSAFADLEEQGFLPERDLILELTFDPPWTLDCLSEEAKAELGF
jgi:metal-sulfur cluster biosynthetic enzyme